jgi:hypothetical protein
MSATRYFLSGKVTYTDPQELLVLAFRSTKFLEVGMPRT